MIQRPRICIDARLVPGFSGGIEQVVIGLAKGFSEIEDGHEEYFFLTYRNSQGWLAPYITGKCRLLPCRTDWNRSWKRYVSTRLPPVKRALEHLGNLVGRRAVPIPSSDGTVERTDMDLIHFPLQSAFLTQVPSIYHPHDLQHVHLPEYFSAYERLGRDLIYTTFSNQSRMVAVTSSWVREDVIRHLHIEAEKVQIVPLAPSTEAYGVPSCKEIEETRNKFDLPSDFAFYPAQTWPHKNHLALVEAAAILRKHRDLVIPLVFSGRLGGDYPEITKRVEYLGLANQVRFLGYVSPVELQSLYRLCRCVIIPTLFEAASFPLWEAFLAGAPTACSNVTSLPMQAGDAALIFDPYNSDDIAACLAKLWNDANLRRELAGRGHNKVNAFTWERTARHFRAHYRRILGCTLTEQDERFLQSQPLL
jgi:glycosyltransferase involved in cell wall biosynthesis